MNSFDKIGYKINFVLKMLEYKLEYGELFTVGKAFSFRKRFTVNINENGKLVIGNHVFFNNDCSINCKGKITVGDFCIFGENVKIYDHNHRFSTYEKKILDQGYMIKSVQIGDNCWIGSNVVILPGANIKPNSIIGAGCVISGEIPEGVIVTANRELHYVKRHRDDR